MVRSDAKERGGGIEFKNDYKVYVHLNIYNKKMYIGVTRQKNPNRRWENGYGYNKNIYFSRAIRKYGWSSFKHIILFENLTQDIASIIEYELIKKYNTNNPNFGYNIRSGGINGFTIDDSTRQRLREKFSGEGGYWYGIYGENHPRYGKKMSREAKNIISEKNRKDNWSEETKKKKEVSYHEQAIRQKGKIPYKAIEKAAEYHRGRKMSNEQKEKISNTLKQNPPMLGVKMSEESRQKMIKTRVENKIFSGTNNPSARAVVQLNKDTLEYIAEYDYMKLAERTTGASSHNICSCCNGKIKSSGGYKWMYKEEYYEKGADQRLWMKKL